ncbi:MAG TPA: UDP-glucose/GDP-mannose dehydrogenase family protein [Gaiellaceae bacterium]|jgi:UDPglucose 6-dehydrogenase
MARIGIFGAGYVGLVTGACFAELGHDVILRDVVPERVERLRAGEIPIYEPGLEDVIARNRERISFTLDVREAVDGAEFLYVGVPTPPAANGEADLSFVWTVIDELPDDLPGRPIVVMKSTVPVGTGEKVRARLDGRGLKHYGYVSNPEFLAEGNAIEDFKKPDRVVVGAFEAEDGARVLGLHEKLETEFLQMDVSSAELVKLAANAFLATRISFINEIANICELVGADVQSVALGMGRDKRVGRYFLNAGIGYGGSCFPKDVLALETLAENAGYTFLTLAAVQEVNARQKRRVVEKLRQRLGSLEGRTIALLGLAFKPETDDMREAASIVVAEGLVEQGATVRGWDPVARPDLPGCTLCASALEAATGADAAVLVTEWLELKDVATVELRDAMANPLIIDGRNHLDPDAVVAAGFEYEAIGRPTKATGVAVNS